MLVFFWLLLLLLFFSSSLLDRERLSGLPGKGRSSGRRPTRDDGGGILSATASYWSNVIVHRAGLIKTNCHRPDHLSQDSLSEPQRLRLSKEVVRHKLVQPRTILVIFVIYRITLSYEDQQVLGTLAHYDGREGCTRLRRVSEGDGEAVRYSSLA